MTEKDRYISTVCQMPLWYLSQLENELLNEEAQAKQEMQHDSTRQLGKARLELAQDRRITLELLKRKAKQRPV